MIKNLIDDRQFVGVVGQGKSAKTWALIHLAVSIASGRPAFNDDRFVVERPGPVVLLLREDIKVKAKRRIRAEVASLNLGEAESAAIMGRLSVWYSDPKAALRLLDNDSLKEFAFHCAKLAPAAVIMDPLKKLHSKNENSAEDMEPVMDRCLWLRELLGCSVLLSHHMGKPNENTNKTRAIQLSRGSSTIGDAFEGLIAFTETDDSGAPHAWTNVVSVLAKNGGTVPTFGLRLEIEDDEQGRAKRTSWTVEREVKVKESDVELAARLAVKELRSIRREAEEAGGQPKPITAGVLAKAIGKRYEVVRVALLERLAATGQAEEVRVGNGRAWVASKEALPAGPNVASRILEDT